jgi:hypothetical protein
MQIALIERQTPNDGRYLYLVGWPVLKLTDRQLTVMAKVTNLVVGITCNAREQVQINFSETKSLLLGTGKINRIGHKPSELTDATWLTELGYPPLPKIDQQMPTQLIMTCQQLTEIPARYVVVDCEFGIYYRTQQTGSDQLLQQVTVDGVNQSIFQISALGFADGQRTTTYLNRFLDNPHFSAAQTLIGLQKTGLSLAEYRREAAIIDVLRAVIEVVLQPGLPLVFWNQANDLKYLINLFTEHYDAFNAAEQAVLKQPLQVFDGSQYMSDVINRSNVGRQNNHYDLPLSGVAGLLNVVNPTPHDALWDALTTHEVIQRLRDVRAKQILRLTEPQPLVTESSSQVIDRVAGHIHQPVHRVDQQRVLGLRAMGRTYRQIAVACGISVSTAWQIVKASQ